MSDKQALVAGIDCGTNSIRLKIARVDEHGITDVVPRVLRVVRLGQGVDKTHRFADDALARVHEAALEFREILNQYPVQALRFVATSATRDAHNRDIFEQDMLNILGVLPEVISGQEEARLSFLGATSVVPRHMKTPFMVIDLGGGSTELVLGTPPGENRSAQLEAYSMNIGSVRMTERHLVSDPPTQTQIDAAIEDIDAHISTAFEDVNAGATGTIIGVSGTVTTMAALALGLQEYNHSAVDGVRLDFDTVFDVNNRFLRMSRAERSEYKTIHPGRIDVVGGGALVLTRVLQRISDEVARVQGVPLHDFVASEHGLLDGIVLDLGRSVLSNATC